MKDDEELIVQCVNAHDRCYSGADGTCPYCEPVVPLRYTSGRFAPYAKVETMMKMNEVPRIFVFGSNLAGIHGAGSARHALDHCGAIYGQGIGRQGNSYAIPTKDRDVWTSLPLDQIQGYVNDFIAYARANPDLQFQLVAIGCGLAGYRPDQIAPMFADVPSNVLMPAEFG